MTFKPGDVVRYIKKTNYGYVKGDLYIVTFVAPALLWGQRINTRCIKTGSLNRGLGEYFELSNPRKSHLPKWW